MNRNILIILTVLTVLIFAITTNGSILTFFLVIFLGIMFFFTDKPAKQNNAEIVEYSDIKTPSYTEYKESGRKCPELCKNLYHPKGRKCPYCNIKILVFSNICPCCSAELRKTYNDTEPE